MANTTLTQRTVHIDQALSNLSIAYMQDQSRFVADSVFPLVPVSKQSDRYYVYDRGSFNRDDMQERAPATESVGIEYKLDNTPTYYCREYSLHRDIPDEVIANADVQIQPLRDATELLTLKTLIHREKLWVNSYFKTGLWSYEDSGVTSSPAANQFLQWNNANADPIIQIRNASTTMLENTGILPNTLVLQKRVYDALMDNPAIIDRIKYGQTSGGAAMVNNNLLAQLFEVSRVVIMSSIENTAAENIANSHSFIGGKAALLCYSAPSPGMMTPSAGYTFAWTGMGGMYQQIRKFYLDKTRATRLEINTTFEQKLICSDLGYYFNNAVA